MSALEIAVFTEEACWAAAAYSRPGSLPPNRHAGAAGTRPILRLRVGAPVASAHSSGLVAGVAACPSSKVLNLEARSERKKHLLPHVPPDTTHEGGRLGIWGSFRSAGHEELGAGYRRWIPQTSPSLRKRGTGFVPERTPCPFAAVAHSRFEFPGCRGAPRLGGATNGRSAFAMTRTPDNGAAPVQRRRSWDASEKARIVEETLEPCSSVTQVARRHGVSPNQLSRWRRLAHKGVLTAAGDNERGARKAPPAAWIESAALFDDPAARSSADRARRAAVRLISAHADCTGSGDTEAALRGPLDEVVRTYWRLRRAYDRPEAGWNRETLDGIERLANQLTTAIDEAPDQAIGFLKSRVLLETGMPLKGAPSSIREMLASLTGACLRSKPKKARQGARKKSHIQRAAGDLAQIWTNHTGLKFAKTFEHAPADRLLSEADPRFSSMKEFTSAGPRFVQNVLLGIDPELSFGEIMAALKRLPAVVQKCLAQN